MIPSLAALLPLVASAPDGQWGPSTLTPSALARKVDDRLATLSKAKIEYHYTYTREPSVGHGYVDCKGTIVSPGVFWIQVPQIDPNRSDWMRRETWLSDGKRFGRSVTNNRPVPGPLSGRPPLPARPAQIWFANFPTVIFAGLGRPNHPLSAFVADATRLGFRTKTEVRKLTYQGRTIVSYRLVASKGTVRYETVVDGKGFLPVSVTNTIGQFDNARWTAVKWNLRPGKALDPKDATFKKQGRTTILSPGPRRP